MEKRQTEGRGANDGMIEGGIPCAAVRDLLPLYIEGLTSDETGRLMEEHLDCCKRCRKVYEDMRSGSLKIPGGREQKQENGKLFTKEVDYLKRIRKKANHRLWIGVGMTAALFVLAVFVKIYLYGSPSVDYLASIDVENKTLTVKGELSDSGLAVAGCRVIEREGQICLAVYRVPVSAFRKSGSFTFSIPLQEIGEQGILVAGNRVMEEGEVLSKKTVDIYEARHAYIGDASENIRLAGALGICGDLGAFVNELQTTEEPYGWKLTFEHAVSENRKEYFDERMNAYAAVLLAAVDNLGQVSWEYPLRTQAGQEETQTGMLDRAKASEIVGKEIKDCAATETDLQELMEKLGIEPL